MFSPKYGLKILHQFVSNMQVITPVLSSVFPTNGLKNQYYCSSYDNDKSNKKMKRLRLGGKVIDKNIEKIKGNLSTNQIYPDSLVKATVSETELREFLAVYPDVARDLDLITRRYACQETFEWFLKAMEYNILQGGKKMRGLLTVSTYKHLIGVDQLTSQNTKLAYYLGWIVEMIMCLLILDDIIDKSVMRRSRPCWHTLSDVSWMALNDALMIKSATAVFLKGHFGHLDCYKDLIQLLDNIYFITLLGESMDMQGSKKHISAFTLEHYKNIVMMKTSYISFYWPVAAAMYLVGAKDGDILRQSESILLDIGTLFQIQDDFLDCFGDPEMTGKIGTDIQENKCSWLAVVAMEKANEEQKACLAECYGKTDSCMVERVKTVYRELDIPDIFAAYEEDTYKRLKKNIYELPQEIQQKILLKLLDKLYRRIV